MDSSVGLKIEISLLCRTFDSSPSYSWREIVVFFQVTLETIAVTVADARLTRVISYTRVTLLTSQKIHHLYHFHPRPRSIP